MHGSAAILTDLMDAGVGQTGVGTLAVVGVGLIGGSIAAAARRFGAWPGESLAWAAQQRGSMRAVAAGLIDLGTTDLATAAREADLMVFCTPVSEIAAQVQAAAALKAGALMTDAGSVKGTLCAELAGVRAFVGGAPDCRERTLGVRTCRCGTVC